MDTTHLESLAKLARYYIYISTSAAQSGHPTSSVSAVELITTLMFNHHFKTFLDNPNHPNNDRLIFSKGHASPLLYALYAIAGQVTEQELLQLRQFDSLLEGHPTMRFPYTEAATGSLGQGLSIGVGMALNAQYLDKLPYRTYVLLGDGEMAEGSNYEALQLASHYHLHSLTGILDVNRLAQTGPTMLQHQLDTYANRVAAFGWHTITIDGHDLNQIDQAYQQARENTDQPTMIIAQTLKGKGYSYWENKNGYHSKQLDSEHLQEAIDQLGEFDKQTTAQIDQPQDLQPSTDWIHQHQPKLATYQLEQSVATKATFGNALKQAQSQTSKPLIVLDGDVSNSTSTEEFASEFPQQFFNMFIAEQNMVGAAVGLSRLHKKPVVSTFGAFLTRAFDQIRMAQYSDSDITFCGAYAGVSLGLDGNSQMALEDLAMFRSIRESIVLYPYDAIATQALTQLALNHQGISYLRLTRKSTPVLYPPETKFKIGGSHVIKQSDTDVITVVAAGITLREALKAYDQLQTQNIHLRIIDLYSVKPLDTHTLLRAATQTQALITVEDHYPAGGLGEAVATALAPHHPEIPLIHLAVNKMPRSGSPEKLLNYMEIDSQAIINTVHQLLKT